MIWGFKRPVQPPHARASLKQRIPVQKQRPPTSPSVAFPAQLGVSSRLTAPRGAERAGAARMELDRKRAPPATYSNVSAGGSQHRKGESNVTRAEVTLYHPEILPERRYRLRGDHSHEERRGFVGVNEPAARRAFVVWKWRPGLKISSLLKRKIKLASSLPLTGRKLFPPDVGRETCDVSRSKRELI